MAKNDDLPRRENKADRQAKQAQAAQREKILPKDQDGYAVGGRDRSHPDGWTSPR